MATSLIITSSPPVTGALGVIGHSPMQAQSVAPRSCAVIGLSGRVSQEESRLRMLGDCEDQAKRGMICKPA